MTDSRDVNDILWQQLKSIPAFRALLRSVEARFYQIQDLPQPILDVGCGDGHFAQVTFDEKITAGVDPWCNPLRKAQAGDTYQMALQALGDRLPFPDHSFASAFSNSVLEHIPDVQPVLDEVSRVLRPGAPFVITVPSQYFTEFLGGAGFLERLGLDGMAGQYRSLFNRISRHAHTGAPEVWADRLATAGFAVERWQYYFSQEALRVLEVGHVQGVPSAVLHALTGHWILGPWESNLRRTEQWVRPFYEEDFPRRGAYLFFLARKEADGPLEPVLPAPRPYGVAELKPAVTEPLSADGQNGAANLEEIETPTQIATVDDAAEAAVEAVEAAPSARLIIPGFLIALTLIFAFLGQSAMRATPDERGSGLGWLGLSALALLLLLWHGRTAGKSTGFSWQLPDFAAIPRQRWYYVPAFVMVLIASSLASSPLNPFIPIVFWVSGAILGGYALSQPEPTAVEPATWQQRHNKMFTLKAGMMLFLIALIVRIYSLAQHPFILNGTEASIGLEALNIAEGFRLNPFGAGWLTNPALPFYLLAVPIHLLGPSVEVVRLLSAFIGALTVPAVFVIGQRLYGRAAGLAAALLLTGSHFLLHFSRLGLTNVWDALITLFALGLIAVAWQQDAQRNRKTWLLAGTAVGLSAYLYTSSHLLPIMLLLLGIIMLLLDRNTLRRQWRGVAAMLALSLLVALPQLLFYQATPGLFLERANTLGILAGQSGWLNAEATRTGTPQLVLFADQLWQAGLAFNATIDTGTSYGAFIPLLNYVAGVLFILGLLLAIFRFRQVRYSMLVVWVAVTVVFAGALLENPPNSHRYIIAVPAVCLLAAIALQELFATLTRPDAAEDKTSGAQMPSVTLLLLLLVAAGLAVYDVGFYFGSYRVEHRFGDRNTEIANDMALYLNELDGEWIAQFYGPPAMYTGFPTIPFLSGDDFKEGVNLFDVPEGGPPASGFDTTNEVFIFLPERYGELQNLRDKYPSGQERAFSGYYADPLFYVYEVRK